MMNDSPTAFERFERWLFWRALLIFAGGGIGLALLRSWLFQLPWLGLVFMPSPLIKRGSVIKTPRKADDLSCR